ncbi:MAG: SRPBCC domain-containing protein [Gemmatimonadaceae bacterium]|nr:SRPBCC domain-containing protein [Gemmatimonadaceae bacterium]
MDDHLELITTRDVDAPIETVWAAWTGREKIARWWGPAGFRSTVNELAVREGGRFDVIMQGPDGTDYPNLYLFDHVQERKQLIYTNVGSAQFGLASFQSVVDLASVGSRTRVTLTAKFTTAADKQKHVDEFHAIQGTRQLLERLEEQST